MRAITAGCLDDPRVQLVEDDVGMLIEAARNAYDAILLDVDNGPEGLTRKVNDWLYSPAGLVAARAALRPDGVLAIWSASPDPDFVQLLTQGGFTVNVVPVAASEDQPGDVKSHEHVLIFARNKT